LYLEGATLVTYSDQEVAALYDILNPWSQSDDFYLGLVMDARAALDVGCGTGVILHRARLDGHTGRLCGIDPDRAMLEIAQRRPDIEWQAGSAASMSWIGQFDLAIMSGHAFQFLVDDDELRTSLTAIRNALVDGGYFAFETRNPLIREWEHWNPDEPIDVIDPAGRPIRVSYNVEAVVGDVITVTETTSAHDGTSLRIDRANLRFLDVDTLGQYLSDAGFQIEVAYGDWSRAPFTLTSREIITIARVS